MTAFLPQQLADGFALAGQDEVGSEMGERFEDEAA
jgi:hypothetical protein